MRKTFFLMAHAWVLKMHQIGRYHGCTKATITNWVASPVTSGAGVEENFRAK
jgi:hypothetical protein